MAALDCEPAGRAMSRQVGARTAPPLSVSLAAECRRSEAFCIAVSDAAMTFGCKADT